ncbi:MAG TPA: metallophosphoesterase [Myxococcota bacterium]|nr:metallophosphoesterase [Myxococcota bacterium]
MAKRPGPVRRVAEVVGHTLGELSRAIYRGPVRARISAALARNRVVTRTRIELARGAAALDGLRLVFLSDVHAGNYFDADDWLGVCQIVAAEAPDLVCLGGDLINIAEPEVLELRKGFGLLQPPLGKYAVHGNHEYHAARNPKLWRAVLEECGVEIVTNRGRRVTRGGASLWLCGVDDFLRGQPDLPRALEGRGPEEPAILLSHHPDFFLESAPHVDLQLSGHTHGGQLLIAGRTPLRHTHHGFWSGQFYRGEAQLYVGRGVGTSFLPIRIGAPGEIAVIELARS